MNPQQIAVLIVAVTLGGLVLLLLLYGRPRRTRQEGLPPNFSRGDPDSVLEGKRLQRTLVWGVAGAVFIAGFLAVYFAIEPFREDAYAEKFHEESVERGEEMFAVGGAAQCAACHGGDGSGGFASTDPNWPAPPLNNVFHRYTRDEITQIVEQGRDNTPMPPWSIEDGGPLNDQKIEDIVNYVESIQVPEDERFELPTDLTDGAEIFARACAVCHGENAEGQAMGQPLPQYYAPDLTTEFHRLGLKVARDDIERQLEIDLGQPPTSEQVDEALAQVPPEEILAAGEESARNTILLGRRPTPMPQWQNRITDEQIDAVVAYLRSIQRVPES